MASRKEEKERLRAQRLEAEQREADYARRRLLLGYAAAAVLTGGAIAGIVVAVAGSGGGGVDSGSTCPEAHVNLTSGVTNDDPPDCREGTPPPTVEQANLDTAAAAAGCELKLDLPEEGRTHVEPGTNVKYGTNPATSGDHVITQLVQADGAYEDFPIPLNFVHSLEHGRIEFQYSPDLPEKDQLAIKGLFDASPGGMLMFPNPDMPYLIAATAWTQLMGCDSYEGQKTLDALLDFRDQYRGNGPESVAFTP